MADRAIAVHVGVLNDRSVEQVVAERLAVPGIGGITLLTILLGDILLEESAPSLIPRRVAVNALEVTCARRVCNAINIFFT